MLLADARGAMRELSRTGVLGAHPVRVVLQLLWCVLRFGPNLYAVASWTAWRRPQVVAVAEPGRRVTFQQLVAEADGLAGGFRQRLGVDAGSTIAVLGRNRIPFVQTVLAAGRLGADVLLLNTGFTAEQLAAVLEASQVDVIVCDRDLAPTVDAVLDLLAAPPGRPRPVVVLTEPDPARAGWSVPQLAATGPCLGRPRRRDAIRRRRSTIIVLTSGTTGPAKAVRRRMTLSEVLGTVRSLLEHLQPREGERTLLTIPLLHGHGLATLGLCVALGGPLFLFPRADVDDLVACIDEERIVIVVLVPTILYRLLDALDRRAAGLGSLRAVISGSAPLDRHLAERALRRLGPVLFNLYGSSELGVVSLATPADLERHPATVGRPLANVEVRVRRSDGSDADRGEIGRVHVGRVDTGDLGHLDEEGRLFLAGRADDLLVCGGENVFPETLEQTVEHRLPYVRECAALGVPDEEYGQAIHLFAVTDPAVAGVTAERISEDLARVFPRTLRPKHVTIVESLPRNMAGKIVRRALRG